MEKEETKEKRKSHLTKFEAVRGYINRIFYVAPLLVNAVAAFYS